MIVHKDSTNLNTVEDVLANAKDLTFGNGDPNSTSGFLVPSYYIFAKNGVSPKEAFKRTLNSSHETNAMAVANKQVDVATFNTESMARLQLTFPEKADNLKVIWKSPLIPSDPLVWRKNLPAQTKQKVYDFLMSYGTTGDEKELKILADLQWAPFRASSNDQLIPIRQLEMFKEKAAIENDSRYSAQEMTEKLADIEAQLAGLDRRLAALDAAREESN
jgi:phosphonate transport system substrate-binding protein